MQPKSGSDAATLRGRHVRLEPLQSTHADGLRRAAADGELWRRWYTKRARSRRRSTTTSPPRWPCRRQARRSRSLSAMPIGEVVGTTRYYDIDMSVPRLSIGYTWYAQRVQRTGLNTEAKLLLLGHAFDVVGLRCRRAGNKLVQPCLAHRDRTPWREAGRRAAQPPAPRGRHAAATQWCFRSSMREWPRGEVQPDRRGSPRMGERIGIVGARGHVGAELIRLIAAHPALRARLSSPRANWAGSALPTTSRCSTRRPALQRAGTCRAAIAWSVDALVLALPNGKAAPCVAGVRRGVGATRR